MTDQPRERPASTPGSGEPAEPSSGQSTTDAPPPGWWQASDGRWYPPESRRTAYGQPGHPPSGPIPLAPVGRKTNGLAIGSLVLGIVWVCGLGSVAAIITGFIARGQIRRSAGMQGGDGLAIGGIVAGLVGLIPTILLALALPAFYGAREVAQTRAVQSELRNALVAEKVIYTEHQRFTDDPSELEAEEPSLAFVEGVDPVGPGIISVAVTDDAQMACLSAVSPDGTVYVIVVSPTDGTFFGTGPLAACAPEATRHLASTAEEGWR